MPLRYAVLHFLAALAVFAQPPAVPSKPVNIKVGATTSPARTVEFVPGTGTTYSLSCASGTCSVTINYTGGSPDVVDFTGASRTAPIKTGTTAPATCTVGDWFFKTNAVAGRNIALCTAPNTWTYLESAFATLDGAQLTLPSIAAYTVATLPSAGTVGRLAVVTDSLEGSCTAGGGTLLVLCRDSGSGWVPLSGGGGGGGGSANYSQSFTNQTSVSITHNAGTSNVLVSCYDNSNTEIIPQSVTVVSDSAVNVTFGSAQSGKCVVNSSGGGGGGGGGGTVFTSGGIIGNGLESNPIRPDPAGPLASQAFYSGSLSFGSIGAGACSEQNFSAPGVGAGDTLAAGFPSNLPAGITGMMYGGANIIVVRLCNVTGSAVNVPGGLTYNARVIGGS